MTIEIDPELAESLGNKSSPDVPGSGTILATLAELDVSLAASRKALVALDPEAIEHCTREQIALIMQLAVSLEAAKSFADAEAPAGSSNQSSRVMACGSQELRERAMRVRDAARLQLALLARAQRKLRALANALAGPETTYGTFLRMEHNVLSTAIELSTANPRGGLHPCRA